MLYKAVYSSETSANFVQGSTFLRNVGKFCTRQYIPPKRRQILYKAVRSSETSANFVQGSTSHKATICKYEVMTESTELNRKTEIDL
jgi:hypothetical protein